MLKLECCLNVLNVLLLKLTKFVKIIHNAKLLSVYPDFCRSEFDEI